MSNQSSKKNDPKVDGKTTTAKSPAAEQRALRKLVGKTAGFEVLHAKGFSEDVTLDLQKIISSLSRPAAGCEFGEGRSGIGISGLDLRQMIEITLRLRSCRDTLWTVAESRVGTISNFVAAIREVPWKLIFSPGQRVKVNANATASKLWHEGMLAERAETVLDHLGFVAADDVDTTTVDLHLKHNKLAVRLALAGEPLGHRGFKTELRSVAPLREDLAAALMSWFERESRSRPGLKATLSPKHIHVPFCGSGTLASESLMCLGDTPLSLGPRSFAFERWACAPEATIGFLRKSLVKRRPELDGLLVHLNDLDETQLKAATINTQTFMDAWRTTAEVSMTTTLGDWTKDPTMLPPESLLLLNPPWGERLGARGSVEGLYKSIGKKITASPQVMGFCICPSNEVAGALIAVIGQGKTIQREANLGGQQVCVVGFWVGYG